jgi:FkbM family methyltransferase
LFPVEIVEIMGARARAPGSHSFRVHSGTIVMHSLVLNDLIALVAARDGYFLVNRKDVYIGRSIEVYGEHGGLEGSFLKSLIKAGDNVIEVGANIGSHTVGIAKAVGPKGLVHAFEAQRACYAFLQAQIAINQLVNIHAYSQAVGRESGKLWVPAVNYSVLGNFGGVALLQDDKTVGSEPVDVVTLDERLGDCPCALIKIDVEGMEEDVIQGASKLIGRWNPLLYVEYDGTDRSKSVIALILQLGYRLWWHTPYLHNPNNFFGVKENIYGNVASFNMFCCRDNHPMSAGLTEIKSPNDPHPLAAPSMSTNLRYTLKT